MGHRLVAALLLALLGSLAVPGAALGHPLGNYTVNRAVSVSLGIDVLRVAYVVDMAEIPAFAALQAIDLDASGSTDPAEERTWADATCQVAGAAVEVTVDGRPMTLAVTGSPAITFPPGVGGLETLRLECPLAGAWAPTAGDHALVVVDRTEDGHVGWREVTIAAEGWRLLGSTVPASSPSLGLTAYPGDPLATPLDVRTGSATFRVDELVTATPQGSGSGDGAPRARGDDPFASLIAGELTLPAALLALLVAAGLGAVHALSPGHGKTLVAAYLIGTRGTVRQAAGLGLTVAATHTLGVFVLGAVTLAAGELFVPERAIAWLSVASGGLVAMLGIGLVWRALRPATVQSQPHSHSHTHPHAHDHPPAPPASVRGLLALGLAGGMVPSASALIVLLAAVSTGRLLFGIGLIVAFGVGMAVVLAGLAAGTTLARRAIVSPGGVASWPLARPVTKLLPVASGIAVLVIGGVVTVTALARIG
jgi:ABC-type nickel/cobalt efflux system permease component RcnA